MQQSYRSPFKQRGRQKQDMRHEEKKNHEPAKQAWHQGQKDVRLVPLQDSG